MAGCASLTIGAPTILFGRSGDLCGRVDLGDGLVATAAHCRVERAPAAIIRKNEDIAIYPSEGWEPDASRPFTRVARHGEEVRITSPYGVRTGKVLFAHGDVVVVHARGAGRPGVSGSPAHAARDGALLGMVVRRINRDVVVLVAAGALMRAKKAARRKTGPSSSGGGT